jgi:hypothetical protein
MPLSTAVSLVGWLTLIAPKPAGMMVWAPTILQVVTHRRILLSVLGNIIMGLAELIRMFGRNRE